MIRPWQIFIWALRGLALAIVLGLSALLVLGAWLMQTHNIKLFGVQTGSMAPVIHIGDAILVQPQPFKAVRTGQIISYRSTNAVIVSHRVRSVNTRGKTVITQGDKNAQPDTVVSAGQIIGRAVAVLPRLGRFTDYIHQPLGLIAIVYLPATTWIVWQLRLLQIGLKSPYRLHAKGIIRL